VHVVSNLTYGVGTTFPPMSQKGFIVGPNSGNSASEGVTLLPYLASRQPAYGGTLQRDGREDG